MSLPHGLTDLRDNQLTCVTDTMCSSMVPGNLSSQLEILSTGQTYHQSIKCGVHAGCELLTCHVNIAQGLAKDLQVGQCRFIANADLLLQTDASAV